MQSPERSEIENVPDVQSIAPSCPNCGDNSPGRFCPACGEERTRGADFSLRRYLAETFNVITSVESNLFRSFAALVRRPGLLTAEYFAGRRKSYLKPLQIFLFCNVIFFFVQSYTGSNTLSTPLSVHMHMLPYSKYARAVVEKAVGEKAIPFEQYQARFNATIENQAKTLVVLMIPMFAVVMQALYWRSRRYFVEHLVFSTHFYSFFLLFTSALFFFASIAFRLARFFHQSTDIFHSDLLYTAVLLLAWTVYLHRALRRVYGQGRVVSVLKCVVLAVSILFVMQLYRFILFFTTFHSV